MNTRTSRITALLNDDLLNAYRSAVEHFDDTDLVLIYTAGNEQDTINAHVRKRLIENPEIPEALLKRIAKPAKDALTEIKNHEVAFWILAFFADGEADCAAVNATLIAPGGNA